MPPRSSVIHASPTVVHIPVTDGTVGGDKTLHAVGIARLGIIIDIYDGRGKSLFFALGHLPVEVPRRLHLCIFAYPGCRDRPDNLRQKSKIIILLIIL